MASTKHHPLDPLAKYYQELPSTAGKKLLQCNCCSSILAGVSMSSARSNFKKHLTTTHPNVYSDAYVMTTEDNDLDADFQLLGKPNSNPLQYRKYICFEYDSIAKRPSFVYCVLSKLLLNQPDVDRHTRFRNPRMDIFLRKDDQLTDGDYHSRGKVKVLPLDYEMGHVVGLGLVRFSTWFHDIVNCLSNIAIQHKQLNHVHWGYLEELAEGLLLHYKVRLLAGTSGKLDLPTKSKSQIARWWFMIIVTSDTNNTNWRYSAFLFPNKACACNLTDYQVTIPQLRAILKYDIFPNIIDQLHTDYQSDIEPGDFEESAMTKWFPQTTPGAPDDDESRNDEPGPATKKRKTQQAIPPIATIDDSD